jgi:hypothetical protein
MAQVVESLPNKHEALSSNSSTIKKIMKSHKQALTCAQPYTHTHTPRGNLDISLMFGTVLMSH